MNWERSNMALTHIGIWATPRDKKNRKLCLQWKPEHRKAPELKRELAKIILVSKLFIVIGFVGKQTNLKFKSFRWLSEAYTHSLVALKLLFGSTWLFWSETVWNYLGPSIRSWFRLQAHASLPGAHRWFDFCMNFSWQSAISLPPLTISLIIKISFWNLVETSLHIWNQFETSLKP